MKTSAQPPGSCPAAPHGQRGRGQGPLSEGAPGQGPFTNLGTPTRRGARFTRQAPVYIACWLLLLLLLLCLFLLSLFILIAQQQLNSLSPVMYLQIQSILHPYIRDMMKKPATADNINQYNWASPFIVTSFKKKKDQSRKPRKDTYPQECLKGYPRDRGRVIELFIGGECLSYPPLIGQLIKGYPFVHPQGYLSRFLAQSNPVVGSVQRQRFPTFLARAGDQLARSR